MSVNIGKKMVRCVSCGVPLSWAAQRWQWKRLKDIGLDAGRIKDVGIRCQKCVTVFLRERREALKGPERKGTAPE